MNRESDSESRRAPAPSRGYPRVGEARMPRRVRRSPRPFTARTAQVHGRLRQGWLHLRGRNHVQTIRGDPTRVIGLARRPARVVLAQIHRGRQSLDSAPLRLGGGDSLSVRCLGRARTRHASPARLSFPIRRGRALVEARARGQRDLGVSDLGRSGKAPPQLDATRRRDFDADSLNRRSNRTPRLDRRGAAADGIA